VRKLLFAASAVATLAVGSMAQAAIHTMDVTWSGDAFGNSAVATGVFTFDDTIVPDLGGIQNTHAVGDGGLLSLSMDISGASSGNGHFTLADFGSYYFAAYSPLNYSQQLIGQSMGNGCSFGNLVACYGGGSGDFNLFASAAGAPTGTFYFQLTTNNGGGDNMYVTSIQPGGVPEPATWGLMIGGFGLAGAALRRRRTAAAAA
jgi:hypothetical protein